ncbi:MAG TPA: amino acid adenylation domain-containing protein [Steroidobacteraceae bacterium]
MDQEDSIIKQGRPNVAAQSEQSAIYPTSISQQHLWFLDQLDRAASAAYHIAARYRLRGSLDRRALRAALDAIVARHAVLRTRFALVDGEPVQRVVAAGDGFDLTEHDLSGLPGPRQQRRVDELSRHEAAAPFELSTGPLTRGALLRLGPEEHVLLITQHHIISDGWSVGILLQELATLYVAFSEGRPSPLPALPLQYADYAHWQRQRMQEQGLQEQLGFWKTYLAGAPTVLDLPSDRPRPAVQSYAGDRLELALPPQLTLGLRALSRRHRVTLFVTLLAGWSALLSRLSGQTDLVIGTPVANRPRSEFEPLIGYFVNMLALRVGLEADPSVAELLAQVKARTLDAFVHQEIPFTRVVEALQPTRSLSHNPIFQVALAFDNAPGERGLRLSGLKPSAAEVVPIGAKFDLTWVLRDDGQSIEGVLDYATDLFERSSVERLGEHLLRVLEAMVADDAQRVSELPLLSASQRRQLLVDFNDTRRPYPGERCVHELFEEQVGRTPRAIALEFEGRKLSYEELNAHANRLAHHLIGLGVRPNDRVAICMQRSLEMVVGLLGVLKAGGAYVPLDPTDPSERLIYMLKDSAAAVLLRQRGGRSQLPPVDLPEVVLDLEDGASIIARQPDRNPEVSRLGLSAQDLVYVIYTSGSTGQPKGAMNLHRGIVNRLLWMQERFPLSAMDRVLHKAPFTFDVSVWELLWPLSVGAQLVVCLPEAHRDNRYLMNAIESYGITVIGFVPPMLRAFMPGLEPHKLRSLRHMFCGGQELPANLVQRFLELLPDVQLHHMYGPTETSVGVISYDCFLADPSPRVPIGRPIANTQIYILDGRGEPVPIGVAGEIHIAGVAVGRGYLNRAQLTTERFVADPFSPLEPSRMYRTGDLGRWRADGNIEFLGRNDFQVKLRGFRVELGEIEAQLLRCAGVGEAVAVAREDEPGEKRLVAYVTAQAGAELSAAQLRGELLKALPEHMIPSAFVRLEAMPLTPNGKLDRKALPLPDAADCVTRDYEAPQGDTELRLARLWAELLQLERVGREDNFFELGGHSLTAMRLMARIDAVFGVHIGVATLFAEPTLRQFARRLSEPQPPLEKP